MKTTTAEEYTEEMASDLCWVPEMSRMSKSNFINHLREFGRIKYEEGIESLKINKQNENTICSN